MSNFFDRIADTARRFPERPAIEWIGADETRVTTYSTLIDDANCLAVWLAEAAGVAAGDRVAILAANDARWVAAFAAILQLGAVVVPLDTGYSAAQVRTVVTDSGARVLLAGARFLDVARDWAEPLFMVPVYLLALYGLTLVPRHFAVLSLSLLAYQTVIAMLFIGQTRYRVPWDFLTMTLAAAALVQLWGRRPFRNSR